MEEQALGMSERELAEKIIHEHDALGLGFRRLVKKLKSNEGIEIGKDTAFRLYHKYKPTPKVATQQETMDDETKLLDDKMKEAERTVELAKAKDEKRRKIAALMVREVDLSFERRTELFTSKTALLDFAKKVLPACSPAVWVQITDFCESEKIDLAEAIKEALGDQAEFEETREDYKRQNGDYLLDWHLRFRIEEWLLQRKSEEHEEETEDSEDYEPDIIAEDEEFVYIQI